MIEFPKLISKKQGFLLFNMGPIIYLIVTRTLQWELVSAFSCGLALVLMNCVAWISARKYKDWK